MGVTCRNSPVGATVNWPTLGLPAATSAVSLEANRARSRQATMQVSPARIAHGEREGRGRAGSDLREMATNKKLMFVALGYALLFATLGFALDAGIAGMIVYSD